MDTRITNAYGNISAVETSQVERVSVASNGTEANANSFNPSVSADGRYVAYASLATNLVPSQVPNDPNESDVLVFDRQTHTTERLGIGDYPSISADGRFVTFLSGASNLVPGDTNGVGDIFVFDRLTDTIERVSVASDGAEASGVSSEPSISADGRFVTYSSDAPNLVPGDTNGAPDVFVFDRLTNTTERVTMASDGSEADTSIYDTFGPSISADGRYVAYASHATNLVPDDTNGAGDVFLFDRQTHITTRVSTAIGDDDSGGGDAVISANGQFVAYSRGLSGVFVFDRQTNTTNASEVTGFHSSISADGRFVTYDDVFGDRRQDTTNVFLYDRLTDTTTAISDPNSINGDPAISADGRFIAYSSNAPDLVPDDTNGAYDVFVVPNNTVAPVDGVVKDGDDGNNFLMGTHRDDILRGHSGNDWLIGLTGDDWLGGGEGDDRISGGKGDDRLDGNEGNDRIFAGRGDDTVSGGTGNDRLWTGKGFDLVVFNDSDGQDRVFGFDHRCGANDDSFDRVQLNVFIGGEHIDDFAELEAFIASGDIGLSTRMGSLTLSFDNGDALTLGGVHTLSAEDWLFA